MNRHGRLGQKTCDEDIEWRRLLDVREMCRLECPDYQPLFVFMYRVLPTVTLDDTPDIWRRYSKLDRWGLSASGQASSCS